MLATVYVKNHLSGTSKNNGKDYLLINFVVTECCSSPFLVGTNFAEFCKSENDWMWTSLEDGKRYEVDIALIPNKREYSNIHYSTSMTGFKEV